MKKIILLLFAVVFLAACRQEEKTGEPHIKIQTQYGEIEIELYPDKAPKTVAAFLSYVDSGFYFNSSFYRVLNDQNQPSNAPKTELIQGGLWKTNYSKASTIAGIPHESTQQTGIHHLDGTISLARSAPGTAGTEFFICVGKQRGLDYGGENIEDHLGFAAFGRVVHGMSVVRKIYGQNDNDQYFKPMVMIYDIKRM